MHLTFGLMSAESTFAVYVPSALRESCCSSTKAPESAPFQSKLPTNCCAREASSSCETSVSSASASSALVSAAQPAMAKEETAREAMRSLRAESFMGGCLAPFGTPATQKLYNHRH